MSVKYVFGMLGNIQFYTTVGLTASSRAASEGSGTSMK
jgi:hypothetical protein